MQGNIERGGRQTVLNREGGGKHVWGGGGYDDVDEKMDVSKAKLFVSLSSKPYKLNKIAPYYALPHCILYYNILPFKFQDLLPKIYTLVWKDVSS